MLIMTGLLVILLVVAVYRATRLITRDKLPLIDIPREAFVQRWGTYTGTPRTLAEDHHEWTWIARLWLYFWGNQYDAVGGKRTNLVMKSLAYLWECDWCMSVWVGAMIVFGSTEFVNVPYPFLVWGAASAGAGLLTELELLISKKAE